jgi:hypothetical protein
MAMTPEQRTASSLRMKDRWQKKKAEAGELPVDPAIREAMAKVPMNAVAIPKDSVIDLPRPLPGAIITYDGDRPPIDIRVDWEHVSMMEGQQWYGVLKTHFERAGKILNARSMERTSGYTCFMCKKHFDGNPGFTDHSYVDHKTGLSPRVDCCGELCVINYNAMRINERHQRSVAQAQQERNG